MIHLNNLWNKIKKYNTPRTVKWVLLSLIITFFIYCMITEYSLRKNGAITIGCIDSCTVSWKGAEFFDFTYTYKGKVYHSQKSFYNISTKKLYLFKNKCFPVLVIKDNPKINRFLVSPEDFDRYGYSYPDSLNWVKCIQCK